MENEKNYNFFIIGSRANGKSEKNDNIEVIGVPNKNNLKRKEPKLSNSVDRRSRQLINIKPEIITKIQLKILLEYISFIFYLMHFNRDIAINLSAGNLLKNG